MNPKILALYLPQFHPFPENDEWWGKGFTEWTNVGRAKPLFKGHYQPRVPADLGYYDLRIPEVREQQAQMAREAGIEGFCYWHYWFGNGKRLLDKVFAEVVESGKPDYPFCLCWANHSWAKKTWDPTQKGKDIMLMEQTYPGVEDYTNHFYAMLPAFMDARYMKVDGKLIFGFFAPLDVPDIKVFMDTWNKLALENGLKGFYFFGYNNRLSNLQKMKTLGLDSITMDCFFDIARSKENIVAHFIKYIGFHLLKYPYYTSYEKYVSRMLSFVNGNQSLLPCLLPNYDHSPRSANKAILFHKSSPELWYSLLKKCIELRSNISEDNNLIFIKAWNEWGEGNYMEPDLKYGKGYIEALRDAIKNTIK